ncbi:hypothetical protein MLD38_011325 [Melastoma candidum]|uniref:Uncharacterized protein n=1 Tax=Melastoma candidum TaxID=119954 RepID=A0ACB9R2A8_9MYRT|nr:hypothetical protein MLD38_011325 [Melastoma candidum]
MALEPKIAGFRVDEAAMVSPPASSSGAASLMNWMHDISFQSGVISSSSEMIAAPVGGHFGINAGIYSGSSSAGKSSPGMGQGCMGSSSSGGFLLDNVPELKNDAGLAVEWTVEEQLKLDEGIRRYANESNIMKFIKIAALLPDKTVRDVALRCRWLTRKRRKPDEHNARKKDSNRKDKLTESSPKTNLPPEPLLNAARSTSLFCSADRSESSPCEGIIRNTKLRLEDNYHAFNQIDTNLRNLKLHENIDLLCRTRNNLVDILAEMRDMPGIMSRMPPLPVSIEDDLASTILPITTKALLLPLSRFHSSRWYTAWSLSGPI